MSLTQNDTTAVRRNGANLARVNPLAIALALVLVAGSVVRGQAMQVADINAGVPSSTPANLIAFCTVLRRRHGFSIGPGEIIDAARVLRAIDVADQRHVRHAWRAIFCGSRDNVERFDAAFHAFFFPGPPGTLQPEQPAHAVREETADNSDPIGEPRRTARDPSADADRGSEAGDSLTDPVRSDEDGTRVEPAGELTRATYSPLAGEGREPVNLRPVAAEWRDAAGLFLRQLQLGLSRRWEPARRGPRLDMRRTWRTSLPTGGEPIVTRWRRRALRSPRIVLLIDGSRSMSGTHQVALDLATAIATVTRRVEVFVFSTALTSLTSYVRQAGAGRSTRLAPTRSAACCG